MFKHQPQDFKLFDGTHTGFYIGVVEDNDDPLKKGRVRVRIQGLHTDKTVKEDKEGIPTNELPWAEPCIPIIEGGVTGYGFFGVPVLGSHVLVMFVANNPLRPLYFASLPSGANNDWNVGGGTYPHSVVLSVHGGHYIELDSSPGAKKIKIYHSSGTNTEILDNGDIKVTGVNDETVDITNNQEITVGNDRTIDTGTNHTETIGGTMMITVTGTVTISAPSVIVTGGTVALANQATQKSLLNEDAATVYNTHTHNDPQGGTTGVPNQQMGAGDQTTNTSAS